MRKKIVTIFTLIVMLTAVFLFGGCEPRKTGTIVGIVNKRETPMTLEEIRAMIQKKYFNADGSAILDYWGREDSVDFTLGLNRRPQEVTGFEVHLIKDFQGKEESYLVEFEPTGHVVGSVWNEKWKEFYFYPSPFKTLKVEKDNRYFQYWTGLIHPSPSCATMVDGELIWIDALALARISEDYRESSDGEHIRVYDPNKAGLFGPPIPLRGLWVTDEGYEAPLYNPEDAILGF